MKAGEGGEWASISGDRIAWNEVTGGGNNSFSETFTWTPAGGAVRLTTNDHVDNFTSVSGDRIAWNGCLTGETDWEVYTWTPAGGVVRLTGISLNIIAKKSPVYGMAEVKLDDQAPVLVDFYSAIALFKQTVWKSGFLASGDHTVTIKWTGTKRTAATDYNINVDAVDVIGVLR